MSSLHSSYAFSPKSKTSTAIDGYPTASPSTNTYISTTHSIKNKIDHRTNIKRSTKSKSKSKPKKSKIIFCCFNAPKSPPIPHYPSPPNTTSEMTTKTKFKFPKTVNNTINTNIISQLQQPPNILSPPSTNILLSSTNTTLSSTNNKIKCNSSKKNFVFETNNTYTQNDISILTKRGYIKKHKIAPTLQGEVFIATSIRNKLLISGFIREITQDINFVINYQVICNICSVYFDSNQAQEVVIKTADKILHSKGLTITETGKPCRIKEDIIQEAQLMKCFMRLNPPEQMIKYYDFFKDNKDYYLVMEEGGKSLFTFTVECHKLIHKNKLNILQWRTIVRNIFAKMITFMNWMHNVVNCCNLDISLENIVMSKDTYFDELSGTVKNLDIRFIDFGLSELFEKSSNPNFYCKKYVGKTGYKSPQVYNRRMFRADKGDVWSLGVCLFMMSIGAPPYSRPHGVDKKFVLIKNGQVIDLLTRWNRVNFIGMKQYDLMMKMLCFDERKRLSIHEVMNHIWMKPYFESTPSTTLSITESNTFQCRNEYCVVENDF